MKARIEDITYYNDGKCFLMPDYYSNIIYVGIDNIIKYKIICEDMKIPHGITFLSDNLFVVANRHIDGGLNIYSLPNLTDLPNLSEISIYSKLKIKQSMASGVVSYKQEHNKEYILLVVCNTNTINKYTVDVNLVKFVNNGILIENKLNLPDGIAINSNATLIACSNHNTGEVLIYKNDENLNRKTAPISYLRGQLFPHGLDFSNDNKYLIVTDAGSPFLFIYYDSSGKWENNKKCNIIKKIITDDKFIQINIEEGGAKGIDIYQNKIIISSEYMLYNEYNLENLLKDEPIEPYIKELQRLAIYIKKNKRFNRNWKLVW